MEYNGGLDNHTNPDVTINGLMMYKLFKCKLLMCDPSGSASVAMMILLNILDEMSLEFGSMCRSLIISS